MHEDFGVNNDAHIRVFADKYGVYINARYVFLFISLDRHQLGDHGC